MDIWANNEMTRSIIASIADLVVFPPFDARESQICIIMHRIRPRTRREAIEFVSLTHLSFNNQIDEWIQIKKYQASNINKGTSWARWYERVVDNDGVWNIELRTGQNLALRSWASVSSLSLTQSRRIGYASWCFSFPVDERTSIAEWLGVAIEGVNCLRPAQAELMVIPADAPADSFAAGSWGIDERLQHLTRTPVFPFFYERAGGVEYQLGDEMFLTHLRPGSPYVILNNELAQEIMKRNNSVAGTINLGEFRGIIEGYTEWYTPFEIRLAVAMRLVRLGFSFAHPEELELL